MINIIKRVILFFIFTLAFSSAQAANDEILYISSYGTDASYINENISSFISKYSKLTNDGSTISIENLNCETLTDAKRWKSRMTEIMQHHENAKLIILLGIEATVAYMSLPDNKYKEIPLYCSMLPRFCAQLEPSDSITCLAPQDGSPNSFVDMEEVIKKYNVRYANFYTYEPKKLIDFARKCFPDKNHFIIISDNSLRGLTYLRLIKEEFKNSKLSGVTYNFIDGRYRTLSDAAIRFREMPPESSIGILCNWRYDANGAIHMNNGVNSFSRANNTIPMFSFSGSGQGYWTIGGYIPKYKNDGEYIAERAFHEFFNTEDMPIDIKEISTELIIDKDVWNTWQLDESLLPQDVKFVNDSNEGFALSLNTERTQLFVSIVFFLIVLTIVCIVLTRKCNKYKNTLKIKENEYNSTINSIMKKDAKEKESIGKLGKINSIILQFIHQNLTEINNSTDTIKSSCNVLLKEFPNEEQRDIINIILQESSNISKEHIEVLEAMKKLKSNNNTKITFKKTDIIKTGKNVIEDLRSQYGSVTFAFKDRDQLYFNTDQELLTSVLHEVMSELIKVYNECMISMNYKFSTKNLEISVTSTINRMLGAGELAEMEKTQKKNTITLLAKTLTSRMYIIKLGGNFEIDDEYKEGTRFVITLPIIQ